MSPIGVTVNADAIAAKYGKAAEAGKAGGGRRGKAGVNAGAIAAKYGSAASKATGGGTGGVASKRAQVAKLEAENPGLLGELKDAGGGIVSGLLMALDMPRAAVVSTIKEGTDLLQGGGDSPTDEHDGASLGNWWDQFVGHYGVGDLIREENIDSDNEWVNRGIGFAGDVLLDPTTYLSFGATSVVKGGLKGAGEKLVEEGLEAGGKALAKDAALEGGERISRALLSREDIAGRLEKLVENGVDRKVVEQLQDDVFRKGAGALPREIQQEIGVRTGASFGVGKRMRVMVPGTEKVAKVVGEGGGLARESATKLLRKTPGLKLLPKAFEAVPGAAEVAKELGPREAWQYKAAWREATDQAYALQGDLAKQLNQLHELHPDVDPVELGRQIERGVKDGAAGDLSAWFETARRTVEETTGTPIARYEDYLPHRLTAEFRDAIAKKGSGGGKAPLQKMRAYRPGVKFLGQKLETGTLEEMESIAKEVIGENYVQMFKDDAWDLAGTYLNEIGKVAQRGGFEQKLASKGLSVELRLKNLKKRLRVQGELVAKAGKRGAQAGKKQRRAIELLSLAEEMEQQAGRAYGLKWAGESALLSAEEAKAAAAEIGKTIPPKAAAVRKAQRAVSAQLLELANGSLSREGVEAAMARFDEARVALGAEIRNASRGAAKAVDIAPLQRELAVADEAARKLRAVLAVDDAVIADQIGRPVRLAEEAKARLGQLSDEEMAAFDEAEATFDRVDAVRAANDATAVRVEERIDELADEMSDARALHGQEVTPKDIRDLKAQARKEAAQYAYEMRGQVEAVLNGGSIEGPPPMEWRTDPIRGRVRSRGTAGEWDWFDQLGKDEQARLTRKPVGEAAPTARKVGGGEQLVMSGELGPLRFRPSKQADGSVYLMNLSVPTSTRGQGAGSKALKELVDAADEAGIELKLHTGAGRDDIRAWYSKFGFVAEAEDGLGVPMTRPAKEMPSTPKRAPKRAAAQRRTAGWLSKDGGVGVDEFAHNWNNHFSSDLSVDEVMQEFVRLSSTAEAAESFANTGRIPGWAPDLDEVLPSFAQNRIRVSELYGEDPIGHVKQTLADEAYERGIRTPEEIRVEQQAYMDKLDQLDAEIAEAQAAADAAEKKANALTDKRAAAERKVRSTSEAAQGAQPRPEGVPQVDEAMQDITPNMLDQGYGMQKDFGSKPFGAQTRGYYEGTLSKVEARINEVSDQLDAIFDGKLPPKAQQRAIEALWKDSKVLQGVVDEVLVADEDLLMRAVRGRQKAAVDVGAEIVAKQSEIDETIAKLAAQSEITKTVKVGEKEIAAAQTELRKIEQRLKTTRVPKSVEELTAKRDELRQLIDGTEIRMVEQAPKDTELLAKNLDQLGKDLERLQVRQDAHLRFARDLEATVAARKVEEIRMVGGGEITPAARKRIGEHVVRLSKAAGDVIAEDELFNSANAARRSTEEMLSATETQLMRDEIALASARGERAEQLQIAVEQGQVAKELLKEAKAQVEAPIAESLKLRASAAKAQAKATSKGREAAALWHRASSMTTPAEIEQMNQIMTLGLKEFADGKWADPAIAEAVKLTYDAMQPKQVGKFLKVYDQLMTRWKAYSLLSPGFHLRNAMGAMFNNSLAGMDPSMNLIVEKALGEMRRGGIDTIKNGKVREAIREGLRHEIVWGDDQIRDIGDLLTLGSVSENGVLGGRGAVKGYNLVDPTDLNFAPLRVNKQAGTFVERRARLPLFVDSVVNKGMSVEEALGRVRKFHFDYRDGLSGFEKNVMKRVMPFYTWTRFNFPLQVEMMFRRPGRYTTFLHAKRNIEMGVQDEEIVPAYYSTLMAIHTPWKSNSGDDIYLTPDLPFRDLSETFNTGTLIGSLSPAIKTPLELAAGKQFFSDIPFKTGAAGLKEMPKAYTPLLPLFIAAAEVPGFSSLGLPKVTRGDDGKFYMQEKDAYKVDQSLPLFGRLRRMFPSEERYQERVVTTYLSVVGGVSSVTNNDSQQYGELLRRERKIKDALKRRGLLSGEAA